MADPKRAPEGLAAMEGADDLRDAEQGPSLAFMIRSAAGGQLPDKGLMNNASTEAIRNMIPDLWKAAGDDQELKAMLYEVGLMVEPAAPPTVSGDQMPTPEDEERAAKARFDNFNRWLSGATGDESIGSSAIDLLTLATTLSGGGGSGSGDGGGDGKNPDGKGYNGQDPNRPDPANQNRTPPKDNLTRGMLDEAGRGQGPKVNIDPEGNVLPPPRAPLRSAKLNDPSVPRLTGPASEVLEYGSMNDPYNRWKGSFVVNQPQARTTSSGVPTEAQAELATGGVPYSDWVDDINKVSSYTRGDFVQYMNEINRIKAANPNVVPPKFSEWMKSGPPEVPLSEQIRDTYVSLRDGRAGGAQSTPVAGQMDDIGDDIVGNAIWPKNPKDIPVGMALDDLSESGSGTGSYTGGPTRSYSDGGGGSGGPPADPPSESVPSKSSSSSSTSVAEPEPGRFVQRSWVDSGSPGSAERVGSGWDALDDPEGLAKLGKAGAADVTPPHIAAKRAAEQAALEAEQAAARAALSQRFSAADAAGSASAARAPKLRALGGGIAAGVGATLAIELGYLLGSRHLTDADPGVLEKLNKVRNKLIELNGNEEVARLRGQTMTGYLDDSGLTATASYMNTGEDKPAAATQAPAKPKLPKVKPDTMSGTAAEAKTAGIFSEGDMADTKDLSLRDSMKALYEKGLDKSKKKLKDNYTAKTAGIFSEEEE